MNALSRRPLAVSRLEGLLSMQRIPTLALSAPRLATRPPIRSFALSALQRSQQPKSAKRSQGSTISVSKATTAPGQAGTDVGRAVSGGKTAATRAAASERRSEITPEAIEAKMLAKQDTGRGVGERQRSNLAGTDMAQSRPSGKAKDEFGASASKSVQSGSVDGMKYPTGEEEVVYTATPSYNPALMVGVAFTMGVFCLTLADLARVGIVRPDEETGEFTNAPAWQRYLFATAAGGIGVAVLGAGVVAPTRQVFLAVRLLLSPWLTLGSAGTSRRSRFDVPPRLSSRASPSRLIRTSRSTTSTRLSPRSGSEEHRARCLSRNVISSARSRRHPSPIIRASNVRRPKKACV